jgi:tripartite-type tricarboxylate transporter receptor subunit TctC
MGGFIMLSRIHGLAAVLGLLAAVSLTPAQAQDAADFYKGKTVHFIVGYSPGGGYDTYARMLAPHFEKATGATVVVENKPGAGGITALNQLVRGDADGLSFQMLNGEASILSQLTDKPGVAYDMNKVSMIARVQEEPHFMLVNPKMPDDIKTIVFSGRKVKFSAGSRTDNLGDYAAVTCEALKMKCQIITGYKGSKGASLALFNGEADALTISESSGLRYSKGGKAKIVLTIGHERSKYKPDIPTVYEAFKLSPADKWWFDWRLGIKAFGRAIVGPPGIPADRLAYLQKVWKDILTDQAVVDELAKRRRGIKYGSPETMKKALNDGLGSLPADKVEKVKEVLLKKFSS